MCWVYVWYYLYCRNNPTIAPSHPQTRLWRRENKTLLYLFFPPLLSVFPHFHTSFLLFFVFLHYFGRRGFRQGSGGRSGQSYIMISNLFSIYFSCSCSLLILTPMRFSSLPSCALFGHTVQYRSRKALLELR